MSVPNESMTTRPRGRSSGRFAGSVVDFATGLFRFKHEIIGSSGLRPRCMPSPAPALLRGTAPVTLVKQVAAPPAAPLLDPGCTESRLCLSWQHGPKAVMPLWSCLRRISGTERGVMVGSRCWMSAVTLDYLLRTTSPMSNVSHSSVPRLKHSTGCNQIHLGMSLPSSEQGGRRARLDSMAGLPSPGRWYTSQTPTPQ